MSRTLTVLLLITSALLLGFGLWVQDWWPLAGGVVALTGAAWLVTEPR